MHEQGRIMGKCTESDDILETPKRFLDSHGKRSAWILYMRTERRSYNNTSSTHK
jgi:hypothetical protein